MKNSKKKYEKNRDEILSDESLRDLEKGSKLFNNWIDYISNSVSKKKEVNYESEKVRTRNWA